MNYIDLAVCVMLTYFTWRGYKRSHIANVMGLISSVSAFGLALLYSYAAHTYLEQALGLESLAASLMSSNVKITVPVSAQNGYGVISSCLAEVAIPQSIVDYLKSVLLPAITGGNSFATLIYDCLTNVLVNLFCFGIIVVIIRWLLGFLVRFFERNAAHVKHTSNNSVWGLVIGLSDSFLILMALTAILLPLCLLFGAEIFQSHLAESRFVNAALRVLLSIGNGI